MTSAPEVKTDIDTVTQMLEKADISGSGIGTIIGFTGVEEGDVHLIAPEGTVNAGDAGVRVSGNLTLAARFVFNADNIQVGGKVRGLPKQEDTTVSLKTDSDQGKEAAKAAEQATRQAPQEQPPSVIIVEVLGYGGGDGSNGRSEDERRRSEGRQSHEWRAPDPSSAVQIVGAGLLTEDEKQWLTENEKRKLSSR